MNDSFEPVEPSLQRPLEYLRSVLIPSETLEAWAVQHSCLHCRIGGCWWPPRAVD